MTKVVVVGAGLAGCEAAWQAAGRGCDVTLLEMKPARRTAAHVAPELAELVCSNSFRSDQLGNAVGLLKAEMRQLGSLVLASADATAVPAGRALAVDRVAFAKRVTAAVEGHPRIRIERRRVEALPEDPLAILATGPLTDGPLADALQRHLGEAHLYFYDAIAPTVYADSVDPQIAFRASRWEDGPGDYWNLPLDRAQYAAFVEALLASEALPLHACEAALFFEGCLPVEELARRGPETLAHGPMKPVGLRDPRSGQRPHAVVQLRQEDRDGVMLGLVGFQTRLRQGEQRRVLRSLPGLAKAAFARYGSVHRNTYLNAPRHLRPTLELCGRPGLFVAGQMAGVEGYVESAALGFLAGVQVAFHARGEPAPLPPAETAHGALLRHLDESDPSRFQPSNVNYGLFPPLPTGERRAPRRERHRALAERALTALGPYAAAVGAPAA